MLDGSPSDSPDAEDRFARLLKWPARHPVITAMALTLLVEGITCLFRFGCGLQSTRDTAWLARFTFGLRIHHGYIGALLALPAMALQRKFGLWVRLVLAGGVALALSDAIHHFLVLWPVTGASEFDLIYGAG
ncbi:MAG: hypothetical protein R6V05_01650 [Candidatus Brocadiia bacterium]